MSAERVTPSQYQVVKETELGQVLEEVGEPSPTEQRLDYLEKHLLRGAEVLNMEPQSWKVPDWIPSNSLMATYAAPGVGKSFFALTLNPAPNRFSLFGALRPRDFSIEFQEETPTTFLRISRKWLGRCSSVQFKSVQISSRTEGADSLSVQFTLLSRE